MKNIEDIEIADVQEILPYKLLRRFNKLGLTTIGDILKLNPLEILSLPDSLMELYSEFEDFQKTILKNQDDYLKYKKPEKIIQLIVPVKPKKKIHTQSTIDKSILYYISQLKQENHQQIILCTYGFNGSKILKPEKIGLRFNISPDEVNTIRQIAIQEIAELIQNDQLKFYYLGFPLIELLKELDQLELTTGDILYFNPLKEFMKLNTDLELRFSSDSTLLFILNLLGFELNNNTACFFTNAKYFFRTQIQKDEFLETAQTTLNVLRNFFIPLNKEDAISEVKRVDKNLKENYIEIALKTLPEIEIMDVNNEIHYQVKLEALIKSTDRFYRILKEHGEPMETVKIFKELKTKLNNSLIRFIYSMDIKAIIKDDRFVITQNDTYLELAEWNRQPITTDEVVKSSIKEPQVS